MPNISQPIPAEPFALTAEMNAPAEAQDAAATQAAETKPAERDSRGRFIRKTEPVSESPAEEVAAEGAEQVEEEGGEAGESIDESLIQAAATHGMSKDEAESYGDSLPRFIARLDRQAAQLM